MVLTSLQYLATCRQVEILEDTLSGLPTGADATRTSQLHRASLEGLIADLRASLDETDLEELAGAARRSTTA